MGLKYCWAIPELWLQSRRIRTVRRPSKMVRDCWAWFLQSDCWCWKCPYCWFPIRRRDASRFPCLARFCTRLGRHCRHRRRSLRLCRSCRRFSCFLRTAVCSKQQWKPASCRFRPKLRWSGCLLLSFHCCCRRQLLNMTHEKNREREFEMLIGFTSMWIGVFQNRKTQ